MPVINNERITDREIERALKDDKRMERLLDKIYRIFSRKPDDILNELYKQMKPYMVTDDSPEVRRKALKEIKSCY